MRTPTRRLLTVPAFLLLALLTAYPHRAETASTDRGTSMTEPLHKLGQTRYVYRYFFKVYDAALYAAPGASTEDVLEARTPFRLEFLYHRKVDRGIILKSAGHMLEKNLTEGERDRISARVEQINAAYSTVTRGDRSSLAYHPGTGTTLTVNGEERITIPGDDFARLYFRIWLGEEPICPDVKRELLGG